MPAVHAAAARDKGLLSFLPPHEKLICRACYWQGLLPWPTAVVVALVSAIIVFLMLVRIPDDPRDSPTQTLFLCLFVPAIVGLFTFPLSLNIALASVSLIRKLNKLLLTIRPTNFGASRAVSQTDGPDESSVPLSKMQKVQDAEEVAQLRKNLRQKTLGDEAMIDRLLEIERKRRPGASEVECHQAAIESWERDNR
jgi:hypothetical protein